MVLDEFDCVALDGTRNVSKTRFDGLVALRFRVTILEASVRPTFSPRVLGLRMRGSFREILRCVAWRSWELRFESNKRDVEPRLFVPGVLPFRWVMERGPTLPGPL